MSLLDMPKVKPAQGRLIRPLGKDEISKSEKVWKDVRTETEKRLRMRLELLESRVARRESNMRINETLNIKDMNEMAALELRIAGLGVNSSGRKGK